MTFLAPRTLFWKYAAWFSGLVIVLLVLSGVIAGSFAKQQSVEAVERLQLQKAHFVSSGIDGFIGRVEDGLRSTTKKFAAAKYIDENDLLMELSALLRHQPSVTELRWVDANGEERLSLSRLEPDVIGKGRSWLSHPAFEATRAHSSYASPIYFRDDAEPYMSLGVTHTPAGSVLIADINLKFVSDFIATIPMGPSDVVYVVDPAGMLISHADPRQALRRSDFSNLPQVRRALGLGGPTQEAGASAHNMERIPVVASPVLIERLGWTVFAEQEEAEAFRPLAAVTKRSTLLVLFGVVAAILAALVLARRMVRPIGQIVTGARAIGAGKLEQRIHVKSGDELEVLAGEFNDMTTRLQAVHKMQEARIAERTHALTQANQAKTRFLAVASHDLRQPMHALALFVGQLRRADPREAGPLIDKIEHSVEALGRLFDGLLDLSKLDMGGVRVDSQCFPLQSLLAQLTSRLAPMAEAKGLALSFVPTSLWARTDAVLLERIMGNLITNAIRYSREGRILVGCRRRRDEVDLVVADTGIGMAAGDLPHIFEEFYRVPQHDSTRNGSGLGLGLAIVQRLVALQNLGLRVHSVLGRGTVIRVCVPRSIPERSAETTAYKPAPELSGVRVLIVDDEAAAREAIEGLLRQWGCLVATAGGGREALAQASKVQPDAVLCDLTLADGESGLDVVAQLRDRYGDHLACAFITGESAPEVIAEARARGFPIAAKPTKPAKLRALLEHLSSAR